MKNAMKIVAVLFTLAVAGCSGGGSNAPDQSVFIGEDRAETIALERANVARTDVIFDRTEMDVENGVWVYELEFAEDMTKYDVTVKADDGTILSFETDSRD